REDRERYLRDVRESGDGAQDGVAAAAGARERGAGRDPRRLPDVRDRLLELPADARAGRLQAGLELVVGSVRRADRRADAGGEGLQLGEAGRGGGAPEQLGEQELQVT